MGATRSAGRCPGSRLPRQVTNRPPGRPIGHSHDRPPMNLVAQHVLVVVGVLAIALAVVVVLQQRRTPQSAAAWLLFIVAVPYVALPLFLALAFRKRSSRFAPLRILPPAGLEADGSAAARFLTATGGAAAVGGNAISVQVTGPEARAALNEIVADAHRDLNVLMYIVENDAVGRDFVRSLAGRARSGVTVRLCLDRLGALSRPRRELAEFRAAGGELRFFSPFLQLPGGGHMNLRNHRKLVIADGRRAWAGGRNVGRHYLAPPPEGWHDLSVTVTGPAVHGLGQIFASNWAAAGGDPLPPSNPPEATGDAVLQTVVAGPDDPRDILHKGLVGLIHRAERRVWIATPYFIPTESLSLALESAAERGVDVRILVPERSNHRIADLARGAWLRALHEAGAEVRRFTPGMLHAKAGLVDDAAWTGSANFDVRSILLNFELVFFLHDPPSVRSVEDWFLSHFAQCETGMPPANLPRRTIEGIFRLGAPVL